MTILEYLETELADAYTSHDLATDKAERLFYMIKAATIEELLETIKQDFA